MEWRKLVRARKRDQQRCRGPFIAKYSCAVATSVDEAETCNTIPQHFKLEQNYPNPFNPGTTIGFGVPVKSFVRLTIYDVLGRHLATLVEGELAAGPYQKYWNASGLPSGVYIYRMEAGAFTESKKL